MLKNTFDQQILPKKPRRDLRFGTLQPESIELSPKASKTVRLSKRAALIGRRELESGAVAFKVYVPGVGCAGDVSFEVSNVVSLNQGRYHCKHTEP